MPKAHKPACVESSPAAAATGEKLFVTSNINFASYLRASGRLRFDRIEIHPKFSEFVFRDPDGKGTEIFREFTQTDPPVSAKAILEARGQLLIEIQRGRV